jgi:glycosyltransferase involved in cell wall biosynthesis
LLFAYNETRCEIIVALEASPEAADRLSAFVSGVRIVSAQAGEGTAHLLNRAAALTCGAGFIVLLAAPAEPSAHWLDELRLAFDLFDNVGVVGAKRVRPNGRLIDAGGVVWKTGNRQQIGVNANAEHPQVNYTRQADYVSLSAIMVSRESWVAVGGLSEEFFDTGIEALDLALALHARGRKVVWAAPSIVTVSDDVAPSAGISSNGAGAAALASFKAKWGDALSTWPPEGSSPVLSMDHGVSGRVLFVDQQLPRGDIDAGSYAAIQEARLFQALGYKVNFLPLNLTHLGVYTRALQRMGVEVMHAPFTISVEDALKERGSEFDLVYVTRHHVARVVLPLIRRLMPRAKVIFNNADLHFLRELRTALAEKDPVLLKRSKLTRDQELDVMRKADLTLSYSEVEHAIIQSHNMDETRVAKVPWVVEAADFVAPFDARRDIVFVGNFTHRPNVEAVRFFAGEVMPLLTARLPDIQFLIYGSEIGEDVESLAAGNVVVKGHFEDPALPFSTARIFVAPLLSGAGLKGKVLSAMAQGVPSILSAVAAEGLGAKAGLDFLPAQKRDEWADAIDKLYNDEAAWDRVSQAAHAFVREHYSFAKGVDTLRRSLEAIDVFPLRKSNALTCRRILPPLL